MLKQQQPIAYQTLSHALTNNKLAHAYILSGAAGTMKKECAILLTQSTLCEHVDEDGFACETCSQCRHIEEGSFTDMILLDATNSTIKKESILKLQHEFSKTGLEHTGKKVYILNRAENATPDALNSLLKFLEEPGNNTMAILLVEQLDRLLPTILSRCQNIPFQALSWKYCFDICKESMDELDAYLLSYMIRQPSEIEIVYQSGEYQHAILVLRKFLEEFLESPYYALSEISKEGFDDKKKRNGKISMQYFIEMMMIFDKDVIQGSGWIEDAWYTKYQAIYRQRNYPMIQMLEILLTNRDKLFGSVNLSLLCDSLVYELKEVIK